MLKKMEKDEFEKELSVSYPCVLRNVKLVDFNSIWNRIPVFIAIVQAHNGIKGRLSIYYDGESPLSLSNFSNSFTFWVPDYSKLIQYYVFNEVFIEEGIIEIITSYIEIVQIL